MMFKKLVNEAMIHFRIDIDSPLSIKSGTENALDPTLPDGQIIRQMRNGELVPVIPGSSLKGVFRSRAEQLMRSQGYAIEKLGARYDGTAKEIYEKSCPVGKLFGNLSMKGRVRFTDAYPLDSSTIVTGVRTRVAINRITGGQENNALFDIEVIESGSFETDIYLQNFELWQLSLILWLLHDMNEGYIRLGSSTSRGYGRVNVNNIAVKIRSYEKRNDEDFIYGFSANDKTNKKVNWNHDLFGSYYDATDLDSWIGEKGLLSNIQWPEKTKVSVGD